MKKTGNENLFVVNLVDSTFFYRNNGRVVLNGIERKVFEKKQEFGRFDILRIERSFGFFVILFNLFQLFGKITLTVTMHHRVVLIHTIQFRDPDLVDFPINENSRLDRCLYQK